MTNTQTPTRTLSARQLTNTVISVGQLRLDFPLYMRLKKTFYDGNFEEFMEAERTKHAKKPSIIFVNALEANEDFVRQIWDSLPIVDVEEAFKIDNLEMRRLYFISIRPVRLFEKLNAELIDSYEDEVDNLRWDSLNQPYTEKLRRRFELYRVPIDKLFPNDNPRRNRRRPQYVVGVKCYDATETDKAHLLLCDEELTKANEAIAWCCRISVSNPSKIYRQGDKFIVHRSKNSETVEPYHLTWEQYSKLVVSET